MEVRRLRREVRARDARDAEVAGQVQRLMSRRRPNAEEGDEVRRRRFWVPSVAVLAAVGGWARHYSGPIAGVVSTAAAVTLFVIAGSGGSTHHEGQMPDPVAPVLSSDAPSSTTTLPPLTTTGPESPPPVHAVAFTPTTFTPTTLAPVSMLTTTKSMLTVPTTMIATTTSQPPTSTSAPDRCLLDVELRPTLRLCVAT